MVTGWRSPADRVAGQGGLRLAFPINAHQNANQKSIGSAPSYWAQCTLPPPADVPDPPFRFFEGLVPRLSDAGRSKLLS